MLFLPLPATCDDVPMSHILSLVLTAMVRSRVQFPDAFLEAWAGLGVVAQPDGTPCFIEDLVDIGRVHRPATATLRNTRLVATGGWVARSSSGQPLIRSLTRLMDPMRRQRPRPRIHCGLPHRAMERVHCSLSIPNLRRGRSAPRRYLGLPSHWPGLPSPPRHPFCSRAAPVARG